ncbi:MAG: hypothetical protein K6F33_10090, partial [Bacteroidales bacterium]|nr:hypothetical protein [Bacteroidales bacterium]
MKKHLQIWLFTILLAIGYLISNRSEVYAQQGSIDEKDYMLLLTSYANDSKQVVDFMQEFEDVNANCPLEVKIESLGI